MKNLLLMTIVAFILCGGAWGATGEPERPANQSLVETAAAVIANLTEILKIPFLKEGDTLDTVLSMISNQKLREALTTIHCAFKYVAAKLKMLNDYFKRNREALEDLQRRRLEFLDRAMRVKRRSDKKIKTAPPLQPSRKIKPLPVALVTESTPSNTNDTAGQPFKVPTTEATT